MNRLIAAFAAGFLGTAVLLAAGTARADDKSKEHMKGQEKQESMTPGQQPGTQEERMRQGEQRGQMPGERTQQGARAGQQDAEQVIQGWAEPAQKAARAALLQYGEPQGVTDRMLVWRDSGAFKRTTVLSEGVEHNFPRPHQGVLEQAVSYNVPVEKIGDLARFSGSILVDRTRGELISRSDSEEHNLIALNLAHEIIEGEKSVEDARQFFGKTVQEIEAGRSSKYSQKLLFSPAKWGSGDPGKSVEQQLTE